MSRILVTTVPFGEHDPRPLHLLQEIEADVSINPTGRRLTEDELRVLLPEVEILIAGTEPITAQVLDAAPNLKLISRVGIGLDNIDLIRARDQGIAVSYTPDAPAPAVADLTLGLMISLLRFTHVANLAMHRGHWQRHMGRRLSSVTVGIIGVGRIGGRVADMLIGVGVQRILLNDVLATHPRHLERGLHWVDQETILRDADLISLHVPLTPSTRHLIGSEQLRLMKSDALLVNTSRGGIVHEGELSLALQQGRLGGAAIDVFEDEPYSGPLCNADRCLLTSHMGSMSIDCRTRMEIEATEEAVRFVKGEPLTRSVPLEEYEMRT